MSRYVRDSHISAFLAAFTVETLYLLPILSKVAEKVINKQINEYLEKTHLISTHQYGFRQKHSTQSLLLQLTNRWLQILDNKVGNRYICLTALDIKKAFDTVDHNLLLSKLDNHFNFHSSSIKLMHSYLSSRNQSVKINNVTSNPLLITAEIPQGSILGPLLFIMFINCNTICSRYVSIQRGIISIGINYSSKYTSVPLPYRGNSGYPDSGKTR